MKPSNPSRNLNPKGLSKPYANPWKETSHGLYIGYCRYQELKNTLNNGPMLMKRARRVTALHILLESRYSLSHSELQESGHRRQAVPDTSAWQGIASVDPIAAEARAPGNSSRGGRVGNFADSCRVSRVVECGALAFEASSWPLRYKVPPCCCAHAVLDSQVARNNRPLYPKVDHYWFKVAHSYEPLALQGGLSLPLEAEQEVGTAGVHATATGAAISFGPACGVLGH